MALSLLCLLFLLSHSSYSLLPAEPPLIPDQPFVTVWNAPTELCQQLHIPLNTGAFQAITTPKLHPGQFLTLFYENHLGLYPKINTIKHQRFDGGVPQNGNLTEHLSKAQSQIDNTISQDSSPGLAVIDWEGWRPLWDQNWGSKRIYQRLSIARALEMAPFLSNEAVSKLAKNQFELAGRRFMEKTIRLGIGERPSRRWGFYLLPDCFNYDWSKKNYTGKCSAKTQKQNDQLLWLWEHSTALFPSVYLNMRLRNSPLAAMFVRNRIQEALRVAALTHRPYMIPIYVYSRPLYRRQTRMFLSQRDLESTIGESAALGAAGIVMWGGTKDYHNEASCQSLSEYLSSTFNPYIANVTAASILCSQVLCQAKGRCIRKDYDSAHCLHLNPAHFSIIKADRKYVAVGLPSSSDLDEWAENFTCQCYAGWTCSPRLVPPTSIRQIWV